MDNSVSAMSNVIELRTLEDWRVHAMQWRDHAARCEALLLLSEAQREASETLLRCAEDELARVRHE